MLVIGISGMWGQTPTVLVNDAAWSYAPSITVGDKLDASSLSVGDKIVFARKSNPNKYITIDTEGNIRGGGNTPFQSASDARGMAVFTVGGSTGAWTFESAKDGYYFPQLNSYSWVDYKCVKTDSPATFLFKTTGDGDNSFFIGCNNGYWFDGNNTDFTAWYGSGDNAKYYIYSVTENAPEVVLPALGEQTNNNTQYLYKSPQITGSSVLTSVRLTFKNTATTGSCNGYPYVHLAEFYLYDKDGNSVDLTKYTSSSIFSSNATQVNEGSIDCLNDGITSGSSNKYDWYWHSAWSGGPSEYHYLEINVAAIDADLSTFQIGYVTRNKNCLPSKIEITTTEKSASELIDLVNADVAYIAARDHQSESNPFVGLKPYSVTNELKEAVSAETPNAETIFAAYRNFAAADLITIQEGKTYRIISAFPGFETKGDNKKKAIYSDGTGLIWKAIDVAADYYKSIWNVANINGNTLTMLNLNDGGYPQAVYYNDTKTPLSRNNVNTCSLKSLGEGQYNIESKGSGASFHCGGHSNGAGTIGNVVRWNADKNSCSAWYIQEITDITMPTTGYYRIKNGKDDKYMQTTTNGVGAVSTSGAGINTIFSVTKNEDGTYYLKGDNGKYVQEASRSSQVKMILTPVKYFITRDKENLWNFRAQAAVESDYDYHYLHTNNNTTVVGWVLSGDGNNSRWTIEAVNDYTYYPVELTGPTGAEMAISVLTDGYTGSTVLYNGGFYAFTGSAPTASSFADYEDDILETNDLAVANNKITASFTAQDITPIFTISDELTNVYYYIHNARNDGSYDYRNWYVRATKEDKVTVTNNGKTTNGAGVFQFYAAETTNPQGYPTYYIYNTGAQAWVKYNSATEGSNKVELVSDKTNANSWLIYTEDNGSYVDVIPGELKITNTAQSWNAYGGFAEGKQMGLYARSDGSSSWALESLTLDNDELATVMNNYVRYYAPVYTGSYEHAGELGYLKQEFLDGLSELADVNTLKSTWQNRGDNDYVRPESGHFYKLLCAGNKNQYIVDSNYNNNRVSVSATDEDNVWCYYKNKLIGYKSGCKLVNNNGFLKLGDAGNEGSDIDFRKTGVEGKMSIHFINNNSDRYAYGNGENQIDGGSSVPNDDYRWKISEVTSIPVTFNKAALGYATFFTPVELKIPENTSAYVCKLDGSKLTFFEITNVLDIDGDRTIPANTAVLLYNSTVKERNENVVVDFSLTSCEYVISENSFHETLAAEAFDPNDTEKDTYSLRTYTETGAQEATKVGFFKKTSGSYLAGFKAWIQMEHQENARNLSIYFDGADDPTGIVEALGLENDNVEIYDMNGRKLSSYKKGINIVNGKKVLVQ